MMTRKEVERIVGIFKNHGIDKETGKRVKENVIHDFFDEIDDLMGYEGASEVIFVPEEYGLDKEATIQEIVDYILGKTEQEVVDIIIDNYYYWAIDQLSEIGTNSFFQYDDLDGYRYVVIDFWKTIAYRIRICKSPNDCLKKVRALPVTLYLYHIDGSKTHQVFGVVLLEKNKQAYFKTICPQNMTADIWGIFTSRIGKIMSTMVLSIHILKREVKNLSDKLDKYNAGKIDVTALLGFEENNIVTTIDILSQLYLNKDKYDMTKTFNQNLPIVLSLHSDTIGRTQEDKKKFIQLLVDKDKDNELSEYIWNGINFFDEIYKNEMNLPK